MYRWSYLRTRTRIAIITISLAVVAGLVVFFGFRLTGWFDTQSTRITEQGGTFTNGNLTLGFSAGDIAKGATVTSRLTEGSRPAPPLALLAYADGPYDIWATDGRLASGKITWSYADDEYRTSASYIIAGISKEGLWQPLPTETDSKRQTVSARAHLLPRLALLRVSPEEVGEQLAAAATWEAPDNSPRQTQCKEMAGTYSLRVQPHVTLDGKLPVACSKSRYAYLSGENGRSRNAIDTKYTDGKEATTEMLEIHNPSSYPLIVDLPAGVTVTKHNIETENTAAVARTVFGLLLRKLIIPAKGVAEVTIVPSPNNMVIQARADADTLFTQTAAALLANGLMAGDYATRQQLLNAVDYLGPLGATDYEAPPFKLEGSPQVLASQRGEILAQLNLVQPYLSGIGCLGKLAGAQPLMALRSSADANAGAVAKAAITAASSCLGSTLASQPQPHRILATIAATAPVSNSVLRSFDEKTDTFGASGTIKNLSFDLSVVRRHSFFEKRMLFPQYNPVGWPAAVTVIDEQTSSPHDKQYDEMMPPTLKVNWPYRAGRGILNDAQLKIGDIPVRVRTVYIIQEEYFSNNLRALTTTPVEDKILYLQRKEAGGGISLVATFSADPTKQEFAAYYALNQDRYVVIQVEKGNALQLGQALRVLLPYLERKLGVTLPY